jgi:alpha-glucosidase (family GH31 glycosyl hydrolase)
LSSEDTKLNPITLLIYLDNHKEAKGSLYIDDGKSFEYKKGNYKYFSISYYNNQLLIQNKNKFLALSKENTTHTNSIETTDNLNYGYTFHTPIIEKVIIYSPNNKEIFLLNETLEDKIIKL